MTFVSSPHVSDGASSDAGAPKTPDVLQVTDLSVSFYVERGLVTVVEGLSVRVAPGETLGIVGESGSGKTVSTHAMMGLIPARIGRVEGSAVLDGRDLLSLRPSELRAVRGREVGMIFQEPMRSLDPAFTVGDQIAEVARAHLGLSRRAAWDRALEMLDMVEIPRARERARDYPHQMSGGMCQRVMIAMALVCQPKLLVADEPTTALDVTVQAQILDLLRTLRDETGVAILFVTHDLGVVAEMCDRVAVMYAGQVVEERDVSELFFSPCHPYTEGLLGAIADTNIRERRMRAIAGVVPMAGAWLDGCRFRDRCSYAVDECAAPHPPLREVEGGGHSRCVRFEQLTLVGVE